MTDLSEFEKGMIVGMRCTGYGDGNNIYLGRTRQERQKELHASNLYGRVGIRKPLVTACHAYSDASGVEHTDSGPHTTVATSHLVG
ncbi:hypothetical protein TNCV_2299041 [Trichonephila clavipes]|nr:hypothetical protein TNCV_2299041 [Trichonephila clavipes]